jgi:hypothetical protein
MKMEAELGAHTRPPELSVRPLGLIPRLGFTPFYTFLHFSTLFSHTFFDRKVKVSSGKRRNQGRFEIRRHQHVLWKVLYNRTGLNFAFGLVDPVLH